MVKTPFSLERKSETCGWAILLFTFTWKSEPVAVLLLHLLPPWLHLGRRALACSCCAPSRVNINVINNVISLRCVVLLQNSSKPKMTRSTSSPLSCNFLIVTLNKYSKQPIIHSDINCIFEMIIKKPLQLGSPERMPSPLKPCSAAASTCIFQLIIEIFEKQNEKATTLLLVLDFPLVLC